MFKFRLSYWNLTICVQRKSEYLGVHVNHFAYAYAFQVRPEDPSAIDKEDRN